MPHHRLRDIIVGTIIAGMLLPLIVQVIITIFGLDNRDVIASYWKWLQNQWPSSVTTDEGTPTDTPTPPAPIEGNPERDPLPGAGAATAEQFIALYFEELKGVVTSHDESALNRLYDQSYASRFRPQDSLARQQEADFWLAEVSRVGEFNIDALPSAGDEFLVTICLQRNGVAQTRVSEIAVVAEDGAWQIIREDVQSLSGGCSL